MQGWPVIHSWPPSSHPRSLYHQQGATHHSKFLLLSLVMFRSINGMKEQDQCFASNKEVIQGNGRSPKYM